MAGHVKSNDVKDKASSDKSTRQSDGTLALQRDDDAGLLALRDALGNRGFQAFLRGAAAPRDDPPPAYARSRAERSRTFGAPLGDRVSHNHRGNLAANTAASLQTKLRIGEPGDMYEQEADRVAEQVLAKPAHPGVGSAPPRIRHYTGQAAAQADTAPAGGDQVLAGPGMPLEPALRQDMEQRFGHDFSRVRIHTDARAGDSARSIDALAYTVGQNVVFAPGRYEPRSDAGKSLLAHELVHVAQQRGRHEILQRKDAGKPPASSGEPIREMAPIVLEIRFPGWIWFTYIDGRFLVRIQADWLAHDIYGVSAAESDRLFNEQRWPDIPDPSLPADRFIGELESRTGLPLLPAARAELSARGRIPLEKYGEFHYAAFIEEADLVRWFGPEQWSQYLHRESGLAAPGATDKEGLAAHPVETNRAVLTGDAELAMIYLVLMEHFTGLSLTPKVEAMASGGLSAEELKQIIGDNAERGVLTDLFTQAWSEYRSAGGKDPYRFVPLGERILEQYQRGNITARANLLRIGKDGWPESDVLGIIHRNNNVLLYDAMGLPMQGISGIALRDAGFIGFNPPAAVERAAEALRKSGLAPKVGVGEALTINQFGQALGGQDAAMVAQATDATLRNIKEVGRRVKKGLAAEVLRVLGETAAFLAAFMVGHAFARLLMRLGNAISVASGAALELALHAAGYIMGLSFLAQTWEILLRAAFHMSRVRNDASGRPTRLSELHMEQAARPIQQLIANAAAIMGTLAFGALIKRVKAGRVRAEWKDPKQPLRELQDTTSKTETPLAGTGTQTPPPETGPESGTQTTPSDKGPESSTLTTPPETGPESSTLTPQVPAQKPAATDVDISAPAEGPGAPSETSGIPKDGIPISERAKKKDVKLPDYVAKNPEGYYYDPKTNRYVKLVGKAKAPPAVSETEAEIAARAKAQERLAELQAQRTKKEGELENLIRQRDKLRADHNQAVEEQKEAAKERSAALGDEEAYAAAKQKGRDAKARAEAAQSAMDKLSSEEDVHRSISELGRDIEVESIKADPKSRAMLPCFAGETLVATPAGLRRVDALQVNDLVLAFDFSDPAPRTCRVIQTHLHAAVDFVAIDAAGVRVRATRSHRFWVEDGVGWLPASALQAGMRVRSLDGRPVELEAVAAHTGDPEPSYNLSIEGPATYFVGAGVLVHNGPVDVGLSANYIIYRATNKANPEFADKVYIGQTTELDAKGRPRGTEARGGEHQENAAKKLADHEAGLKTLSKEDQEFYRFMKDAELEPIVRGIETKEQADYLEQLNLEAERKLQGTHEENVINRREQIASESHMKEVIDAIKNDPAVKAKGYCP